jgi:hypothetical protein
MTKLTNEELQTKAQILTALTGVWDYVEEDISVEIENAMTKLALQLARDVNGLSL